MAIQDKDTAIRLVSDNNERQNKGWAERAYEFIKSVPTQEFITEEVRDHAYANGLERPHDDRAWGHVMKKAAANGLIVHAGYAPAPKAHHRPCPVWKRTVACVELIAAA